MYMILFYGTPKGFGSPFKFMRHKVWGGGDASFHRSPARFSGTMLKKGG